MLKARKQKIGWGPPFCTACTFTKTTTGHTGDTSVANTYSHVIN